MKKPTPNQYDALAGDPARLRRLVQDLEQLRARLLRFEVKFADRVSKVHRAYESSARNLLHYIAMRQHDIRQIQEELGALGLSSLGRSESHVMASLDAVLAVLGKAVGQATAPPRSAQRAVSFHEGSQILDSHTEAQLGVAPPSRRVRIMVTLPSEAAGDFALVRDLLKEGMDCARINCAHDDAAAWGRMVKNIRQAERELAKPCRILMDLAGPKLRTGELAPGPRVVKWRPKRDVTGQVVTPARIWLTAAERPQAPPVGGLAVPVSGSWLATLSDGDTIELGDLRGRQRELRVIECQSSGCWAEAVQTAYVGPGTEMRRCRDEASGAVGEVPPVEQPLTLFYGDRLILTADPTPGHPAVRGPSGEVVEPARIACSLPEIFPDVKTGERIWLDDGKIGGVLEKVGEREIQVRIVRAKDGGIRLGADKGINLPDSDLRIKGLTADDLENLPFIARHADLVALSFLRGPDDVSELQARLAKLRAKNLGIILKIETRKALENLPAILLTAMRSHPVGVMIARGDLAVEVGFERLAEAQEDILWICEASHIPVIWATQVLENLTKQGLPSRAEITDAAMSVRAECVMLNKGPFIRESLHVLDDILQRMAAHQAKKRSLLGRLDVSDLAD